MGCGFRSGASKQIRTADLILTKDALCHLSYGSLFSFRGRCGGEIMVAAWNVPLRLARDLILTKDALCRLSYGSLYNFSRTKKTGDPERARTVDLQRDRLAF